MSKFIYSVDSVEGTMSNTVHTPLYASAIPGPLKVKQIWVSHGGLLGSISIQQTN